MIFLSFCTFIHFEARWVRFLPLILSADRRPDLRKKFNVENLHQKKVWRLWIISWRDRVGGFIKVVLFIEIFSCSLQKCRAINVLKLYPLPGAEQCCKLICDTQRNIFLPPTEIFCTTYINSSATHRNIFLPPLESLFVPPTKIGSTVTLDPSLLTRALLCILPLVSYVWGLTIFILLYFMATYVYHCFSQNVFCTN